MSTISLDDLLGVCADDGTVAALRIATELEPIGGPGAPVKPAVYEGGKYQRDARWSSPEDAAPTPVIVIDNAPSQANRLEAALRRLVPDAGLPELVLDLSSIETLPAHLPTELSSWQFPHRNADAYLRDAEVDGVQFITTPIGRSIADATAWAAGPLVAWFPQALIYGFWQSHLGTKRSNAKLARAWVSEIIGWSPAATETRLLGLKGDDINLATDQAAVFDRQDLTDWNLEGKRAGKGVKDGLSAIGHGQATFMQEGTGAPAAVSFARVTQTATLSFAQLRQVGLGIAPEADAAARALVAAMAVCGHVHAFGRGFALRSGADLVPVAVSAEWVGGGPVDLPSRTASLDLLATAKDHAEAAGVDLQGWGREPLRLTPRTNLAAAISATWPLDQGD